MGQRVIPGRLVKNRLGCGQKQEEDEEEQKPHATMVGLREAICFVEEQRDSKVSSKEKEKRKQQGEDEEPQGKLLKHAKHVGAEQGCNKNQALRA